eukprot:COSAG01_NODE_469_length_16584_cov_10.725265_9_plen_134_part_00
MLELVLQQAGREHHQKTCSFVPSDGVCYLDNSASLAASYAFNAAGPSCCYARKVQVPDVRGGVFAVKTKSTESIVDAVRWWNPMCSDALDLPAPYVDLLQGAMGDAVDATACGGCSHSTPLCHAASGRCVAPR